MSTQGFTYDPKEAIKPVLHAQACVRAIEAIGGDPESVGKLVTALKSARDHLEYCNYGDEWERECAQSQGLADKIESALKNVKNHGKS